MVEKGKTGGGNRQSFFWKAWEVLFPYLLYYLVFNAAYLILAFAYQATVERFGEGYGQFMTAHAATVTGVMGGLCTLAGILPVVPMLKEELRERGETRRFAPLKAALTAILACSVSLGLNALLTLTGFADSSQTYQKVADKQYGVAFAAGLVLYGVISPFAEEVVFRGVIYNRLRRLYSPAVGIVMSGALFGAFHGNLVQGVYGACLGMLMAYLYERSGKFGIPFLFHAVANLAVYTTARLERVQEILFTPAGCAVLLVVSAGCVLAVHRSGDITKNTLAK
ncbi:MAG: CPBP family intramembrane metalloprotease [Lachnospiraceae bacterium]|nr:CPBP family intramembrane metalloprotease [Lachnospiraceae bacterium]